MVSRATRWRLSYEDGRQSEWLSKGSADALLAEWDQAASATLAGATESAEQAREEFEANTHLEVVSIHNPHPFQVDYQKPTLVFPDESTMQFEEGASEGRIRAAIEAAARDAHPGPAADQVPEERPALESMPVWEREFLADEGRLHFPDISSWDHFFPMLGVIETLDELSQEGWSVLTASEDRGLHRSDLAENASAPLIVRYLLVRESPTSSPAG